MTSFRARLFVRLRRAIRMTIRDVVIIFIAMTVLYFGQLITGERGRHEAANYWMHEFQRMREEVDPKQGWRHAQTREHRRMLHAERATKREIRRRLSAIETLCRKEQYP